MGMIFLETSEQLQAADIKTVEATFNIRLPIDFTKHYLEFNGGYPEKADFTWQNNQGTTRINCFFSIKHEGFNSLESTYQQLVIDEEYLPIGIVPFAADDGGNFFCISARKGDYDCVYYCNNDHYEMRENEGDYLELLTSSFNGFLSNLNERP